MDMKELRGRRPDNVGTVRQVRATAVATKRKGLKDYLFYGVMACSFSGRSDFLVKSCKGWRARPKRLRWSRSTRRLLFPRQQKRHSMVDSSRSLPRLIGLANRRPPTRFRKSHTRRYVPRPEIGGPPFRAIKRRGLLG